MLPSFDPPSKKNSKLASRSRRHPFPQGRKRVGSNGPSWTSALSDKMNQTLWFCSVVSRADGAQSSARSGSLTRRDQTTAVASSATAVGYHLHSRSVDGNALLTFASTLRCVVESQTPPNQSTLKQKQPKAYNNNSIGTGTTRSTDRCLRHFPTAVFHNYMLAENGGQD